MPRDDTQSHYERKSWGVRKSNGAEGGTRTPTPLRELRPERSASTNFTTSAVGGPGWNRGWNAQYNPVDRKSNEIFWPTVSLATLSNSLSINRLFGYGSLRSEPGSSTLIAPGQRHEPRTVSIIHDNNGLLYPNRLSAVRVCSAFEGVFSRIKP